jgi:hypothetical protein
MLGILLFLASVGASCSLCYEQSDLKVVANAASKKGRFSRKNLPFLASAEEGDQSNLFGKSHV